MWEGVCNISATSMLQLLITLVFVLEKILEWSSFCLCNRPIFFVSAHNQQPLDLPESFENDPLAIALQLI